MRKSLSLRKAYRNACYVNRLVFYDSCLCICKGSRHLEVPRAWSALGCLALLIVSRPSIDHSGIVWTRCYFTKSSGMILWHLLTASPLGRSMELGFMAYEPTWTRAKQGGGVSISVMRIIMLIPLIFSLRMVGGVGGIWCLEVGLGHFNLRKEKLTDNQGRTKIPTTWVWRYEKH